MIITIKYLRNNPNHIFVFGDNLLRKGKSGAAALRDEPNTYGFITKRAPNNHPSSFYTSTEYMTRFRIELINLEEEIKSNPQKIYLISKLGSGLANRHQIWEKVISQEIYELQRYKNVSLLFG